MNLPNSITLSRIAMIPLLLWILSPHFPLQGPNGEQEILASVLFVLASITDGLDGYLARKRAQITTMGMLLDPIADKIMVTGALIALVAYNPQVVKVWIVVVIIAREFLISGLRSIASTEGFTIQASDLGKLKTVVQIVCVVSAVLAHRWYQWQFGVLVIPVQWIAIAAIYFTVLVSTISAIDYFVGVLEADRPCVERSPAQVCADAGKGRVDYGHESLRRAVVSFEFTDVSSTPHNPA